MIYLLVPQHRDRREALRGDLLRLGEVAAGKVQSRQPVTGPQASRLMQEQHDGRGGAQGQHGIPDPAVGEDALQPVTEEGAYREARGEQQRQQEQAYLEVPTHPDP